MRGAGGCVCPCSLCVLKIHRADVVVDDFNLLAAVAPRLFGFVYDNAVNKLVDYRPMGNVRGWIPKKE